MTISDFGPNQRVIALRQILCIEDNPEMRILVEASLPHYRLSFAETLSEARDLLGKKPYDLIILDLELPDGNGLSFFSELKKNTSTDEIPVFILTGKTEISNKVLAFNVGAEDFIAKPFDPLELSARIDAKIKRLERKQDRSENFRIGDLLASMPKQRVWRTTDGKDQLLELTSIEFKILMTLARSPDRIYSRNQLLDEVWGNETHITDRTVDTHVGHLRKKMQGSKVRIETVIGEGYRLVIPT